MKRFGATAPDAPPLGVVALDMRTANLAAAAHHQKIMIARTPWRDVGFCGGVDLAYTRRDAPVPVGDWASGPASCKPTHAWPREDGVVYESADSKQVKPPGSTQCRGSCHAPSTGRPPDVARPAPAARGRRRPDAGVELRRALGALRARVRPHASRATFAPIRSSSARRGRSRTARVIPLPDPRPIARTALTRTAVAPRKPSRVQMWRTIPLHKARTPGRHLRGEFTAMYGISEACRQATETDLDLRAVPMEPSRSAAAAPPADRDAEPAHRHRAAAARRRRRRSAAHKARRLAICRAPRRSARADRRRARQRLQPVAAARRRRGPRHLRPRQGADVRRRPARVRIDEPQPALVPVRHRDLVRGRRRQPARRAPAQALELSVRRAARSRRLRPHQSARGARSSSTRSRAASGVSRSATSRPPRG